MTREIDVFPPGKPSTGPAPRSLEDGNLTLSLALTHCGQYGAKVSAVLKIF